MEKKSFIIDSSIVAKWFMQEKDSKLAISVRDDFGKGQTKLIVPTLLFYEVMNALRFSGSFDGSDLGTIAMSLSKYQFEIWKPVGKLLELSARLSLKKEMTVYDACYVALAQRVGSKVITEDKELLDKFPALTVPLDYFARSIISENTNGNAKKAKT
jgi:predicted nucleic acid-binding protein